MSTHDDLDLAHRTRKALTLRLQGLTFREVAEQVGVSVATAHKYVTRALADIPKGEADTLRALECERLDALQAAYWDAALAGNLDAADRVLRIIDRRARLLGLDAPQRMEMNTGDVDLDATVSKLITVAGLVATSTQGGGGVFDGDGDQAAELTRG